MLAIGCIPQARSDFVIYRLPGTKLEVILEGKTKVVPGRIFEYTHPTLGSMNLSLDDAIVVKAPTRLEEFKKYSLKAAKSKDIQDYLEAARQAIKRGMLKEFYECCSAAHKLDPEHPTVKRLAEARRLVKRPLGDHSAVERKLRESSNLLNWKVEVSSHYVVLHDTSDVKVGRKTRAKARIDLLETVYESYFMKFALDGVVLQPPKEHLMILLFAEEKTFHRYAMSIDPDLQLVAGYWSHTDNIGVFYDQGSTKAMKLLASIAEDMQRTKVRMRGTAASQEMAHLANSFELLVKVAREESDIEVVSHEATHQLAANSEIMPRTKVGARWAHEGLASYFETPAGAGWGGIGAVNQTRLADYRVVARDPRRSRLELIVSDQLFYVARNHGEAVEAYGQAWALTYFLMEAHFEKLREYYKRCLDMEDEATPQSRVQAFSEVFGDLRLLEQEFHRFMGTVKSDLERMREASR